MPDRVQSDLVTDFSVTLPMEDNASGPNAVFGEGFHQRGECTESVAHRRPVMKPIGEYRDVSRDTQGGDVNVVSKQPACRRVIDAVLAAKVETFLALYLVSRFMTMTPIQDLLLRKACLNELHMNASVCARLDENESIKDAAERISSTTSTAQTIVAMAPSSVVAIFIGPWCDKYGYRLPLVVATLGFLASTALSLMTVYRLEMPLYVNILSSIPDGLSGGLITVFAAVHSVAAVTTGVKGRRARFFGLSMVIVLFITVGGFLGGQLYGHCGLKTVLGVSLFFASVAVLWAFLAIEDIVMPEHEADGVALKLRNLFKVNNLCEGFKCTMKARPQKGRAQILCLFGATCGVVFEQSCGCAGTGLHGVAVLSQPPGGHTKLPGKGGHPYASLEAGGKQRSWQGVRVPFFVRHCGTIGGGRATYLAVQRVHLLHAGSSLLSRRRNYRNRRWSHGAAPLPDKITQQMTFIKISCGKCGAEQVMDPAQTAAIKAPAAAGAAPAATPGATPAATPGATPAVTPGAAPAAKPGAASAATPGASKSGAGPCGGPGMMNVVSAGPGTSTHIQFNCNCLEQFGVAPNGGGVAMPPIPHAPNCCYALGNAQPPASRGSSSRGHNDLVRDRLIAEERHMMERFEEDGYDDAWPRRRSYQEFEERRTYGNGGGRSRSSRGVDGRRDRHEEELGDVSEDADDYDGRYVIRRTSSGNVAIIGDENYQVRVAVGGRRSAGRRRGYR
ncbi:uncharacterized protein LOC142560021 isoform X1 [Dermacentor variabilis]|uniref:uncharacterized protein LOC142560021 isoform X1 n=1 Tax=Dermacentor variabilis TaxID=34621 RepID=UPI003F5AE167